MLDVVRGYSRHQAAESLLALETALMEVFRALVSIFHRPRRLVFYCEQPHRSSHSWTTIRAVASQSAGVLAAIVAIPQFGWSGPGGSKTGKRAKG